MKKIFILFSAAILALLLASCAEESNPAYDQENFTAIFDNNKFSASYFPIDLKQTPDGGYLVLGGRRLEDSNFSGIYILKVDKYGHFIKEVEVDAQYVNPVGDLMESGGQYYFFCMDELTLQSQLVQLDAAAQAITIQTVNAGITYPTAAAVDGNNFILLSYNNVDKQTVISLVNATGGLVTSKAFDIGAGDDVEEPLINHFIRTGRQLPFAVGRIAGGLYYFNGFHNYTFSLVFTDLNNDDPVGVVQGQQDDGGFSALFPLGGGKFAASRFNFGDNYLLPNVNLSTNTVTSSVDLGGNSLPELVSNAPVKIIRVQVDSKTAILYGSNTKSGQIGLLFYDEATGTFKSSRYLGFSNPFEIASVTQTSDGGLAVCGTTYLAGRFPRISLFKISKGELAGNIQ